MDMLDTPQWLISILSEKFFHGCIIHRESKKNEKNVFCLDCCHGICTHCLSHHHSHRLLQIRRYVYHEVLRIADADKVFDCAQIQTYTTNGAKVVFLNPRPQTRPPRPSGSLCFTCGRTLQESSLFCSISCKLQHILRTGFKLSSYLPNCKFLLLSDGSDDGQMTPDSVLEPGSVLTDSGSGSSSGGGGATGLTDCPLLSSTATTEVVRKRRSSLSASSTGFRPACRPVARIISESMMNRRKGTPHRSPLR